jgi:hypothetical protein
MLTSQSLPIATRALDTKYRYSLYWGWTNLIYSAAWSGSILGLHDSWECWEDDQKVVGACLKEHKDTRPQVRFIADSTSTLSLEEAGKSEDLVKRAVEEILADLIFRRSEPWDQYELAAVANAETNDVLPSRKVSKESFLSIALKDYTRKFLLTEEWMLVSMYHQNPVTLCLATLDSFAPKRIAKAIAANVFNKEPTTSKKLLDNATKAMNEECNKHELHPELQRLRKELLALRAVQN